MLFKNAKYPNKDFVMELGDIEFENGKITRIGKNLSYNPQDMVVDCDGFYIVPSFTDVHCHGADMEDASDGSKEGILKMAKFLLSEGVGHFCPTIMAVSKEEIINAFKAVEEAKKEQTEGAKIAGVNLEAPFISKEKKGAQSAENMLDPNFEFFKELTNISNIKLLTIAPELKGAMEFIEKAKDYCTVSLGHTTASYKICKEAFQKGASHVTHLFNAMPPLHHREPSLIGAFMGTDGIFGEIICDGHHINPDLIKTMFEKFGDKLVVISDSTRLCGMPDGTVGTLGGQEVTMKNGAVTLASGTIAGASLSLHKAFLNLLAWGVPMGTVLKSLCYNPAKVLHLEDSIGSIEVGKNSSLLVLDNEFNIVAIEN